VLDIRSTSPHELRRLELRAKIALARGATMAHGDLLRRRRHDPDERRYSSKWFYQCIQSRYGFNPAHLQSPMPARFSSAGL